GTGRAGVDQERSDGRASSGVRDVVGIGNEKAVAWCGRELLCDADVSKRHLDESSAPHVSQPQTNVITRIELKIPDRLRAEQDSIELCAEFLHEAASTPALE